MKVRCYWNLHKKLWSVQDAKTRRVIGHVPTLLLRDVTFQVSAAGRERVLREHRKNVHAYACGESDVSGIDIVGRGRRVSYNPYVNTTFVLADDGTPIKSAPLARLWIEEPDRASKARVTVMTS